MYKANPMFADREYAGAATLQPPDAAFRGQQPAARGLSTGKIITLIIIGVVAVLAIAAIAAAATFVLVSNSQDEGAGGNSPTIVPVPGGTPTVFPSQFPTLQPTLGGGNPTVLPTTGPESTSAPTKLPTNFPTPAPVPAQTNAPTLFPTNLPTPAPVPAQTNAPTLFPTNLPTPAPVPAQTNYPTNFPTASPQAACTVPLGVEIRTGNNYVGLMFPASVCPSPATGQAFINAANKWSSIIAQNLITPVQAGQTFTVQDLCFLQSTFPTISATQIFDHLIIYAETAPIDGVNGILGQSSPCVLSPGQSFPIIGGMQFDSADLAQMEADGTIGSVIEHEMAHVLGFGSIWDSTAQGGASVSASAPALLKDPIFTFTNNGFTTNANNIPKFIGTSASSEFATLAGVATEAFVPVEDGRVNGKFTFFHPDTTNGDGQGSIDSHWKIENFNNELMTFAIDPSDATHPLSRMTIASLEDLGYVVDKTKADAFSLGSAAERSTRLRGGDTSKMVLLSNDIPFGWWKGKEENIAKFGKVQP